MTYNTKEDEYVKKNFNVYLTQLKKVGTRVKDVVKDDGFHEQIREAPASTMVKYTRAYEGGLVEHSLTVLNYMVKLREAYGLKDVISTDSLILVSLLHDIGKAGTIDGKPYYFPQQSEWHRNKLGQNYEINDDFLSMPVSQMSLYTLTKYNVELTRDEWEAISSIRDKNKFYEDTPQGESLLTILLQQSVKMACFVGKNKYKVEIFNN